MIVVFKDTATTEIYTLSLHDALPISLLESSPAGAPGPPSEEVTDIVSARAAPGDRKRAASPAPGARGDRARDRKSTRLNSSHMSISYAVFCLKKKTNHI